MTSLQLTLINLKAHLKLLSKTWIGQERLSELFLRELSSLYRQIEVQSAIDEQEVN